MTSETPGTAIGWPGLASFYENGVHLTLGKWERFVGSITKTHTTIHQISEALNRAADEVLNVARHESDERLRDAVNLVVNAGLHFVEHPDASLQEAVKANYDEDFATGLLESLR